MTRPPEVPRDPDDPFSSAFRLEERDGQWWVEQLDGDMFPATSREIALWGYVIEADVGARHWMGNHKRENQLKREANARVRILRDALDGGLRLAYAVPGAFPDGGDDYIPDEDVGVSIRRNREAARGMVDALKRTGKRGMPR